MRDLETRREILRSQGKEEQLLTEFDPDTLLENAPALFDYHLEYHNLHLYSDMPFDADAGVDVLRSAESRLGRSPLYQRDQSHSAFICNEKWRESFFLKGAGRFGGKNYYSKNRHVFLAKARIEDDALLSPRGNPIAPPRTLTYYVSHEFTHNLVAEYLKQKKLPDIPVWLREGYADYVALGPFYTFEAAQNTYYNRSDDVHETMAEDYLRYGMMTTYLLQRRGRTIEELLARPPDEATASRACGLKVIEATPAH